MLELGSPVERDSQRIPIARGLTNAVHRLEITADGPLVLDGFVVGVRELPFIMQPLPRAVTSLLTIGGAIGVALIASRRRRRRPVVDR